MAKQPTKKAAAKTSPPKYTAPALEKGIDVIEYLSERDGGETLTSIARGIGRSNSEIFRMLAVLEARGIIERSGDQERFQLTDKLFRLGLAQPKRRQLLEIALPEMRAYTAESGQSCHLSIRSGDEVVVVLRVESQATFGIAVQVGHRRSLIGSPTGHCLLAFAPDEEVERVARAGMPPQGGWTRRTFLEDIARVRNSGHCIMEDGFVLGIIGLAAPIIDERNGRCIAAVNSPIANFIGAEPIDLPRRAETLMRCTRAISAAYSA